MDNFSIVYVALINIGATYASIYLLNMNYLPFLAMMAIIYACGGILIKYLKKPNTKKGLIDEIKVLLASIGISILSNIISLLLVYYRFGGWQTLGFFGMGLMVGLLLLLIKL